MTEKLTDKETEMLVKMSTSHFNQLSATVDKPNMRVVNSLVRKGLAQDIMGTFFKITNAGLERIKKNG